MIHRRFGVLLLLLVVIAGGLLFAASRFSLSALNEPGRAETYLATRAKRWLIGRSARGPLPAPPSNDQSSVDTGEMTFGMDCAGCHGKDGRTPTDLGRWMYPRALDLGSPDVQRWSDAELFWIIKNGIRLSGMPGFGKTRSDPEIWHLVHYVRSLAAPAKR